MIQDNPSTDRRESIDGEGKVTAFISAELLTNDGYRRVITKTWGPSWGKPWGYYPSKQLSELEANHD